jgi:hypothetical protein
MSDGDITKTDPFRQAAAEAREELRRYWAQPGHKSYPVPSWFIPLADRDTKAERAIHAARKRRAS